VSPSIATIAKATRVGLLEARTSDIQRRARIDHRGIAVAIAATLAEGDDAVDVGAHKGHVLNHILMAAPKGRHLAVEPLPEMAEQLRARLPEQAIVEEYALTDDQVEQEMEFLHVMNHPGYSGLRERDYPDPPKFQRLRVKTISLDELVDRHGLEPRLIKIDVQGAEALVMQGARQTIKKFRPTLLVEHGSAASGYGESSSTFHDLAEDLGLRIFDFDGHGPYERDAFVRATRQLGYFNFLLWP
jgi:FkbM family methyltransferase